VRQGVTRIAASLEERAVRDKKELREIITHEASDLSRRMDKCNIERLNDSADLQTKLCLLGRSASKHLESLQLAMQKNSSNMMNIINKCSSVMFSAYRDDDHTYTEQNFVTFSGCTVNIGNGFNAKTGMFQSPEPGTYLFMITVATYDGKHCDLSLRKNGKVIVTLNDKQVTPGRSMISQQCLIDLETSDRVQIFAEAGSGISDSSTLHLTQFSGILIRPSQDNFKLAMKAISEEEGLSFSEGFGGLTPSRGATPNRGFTPHRSLTPDFSMSALEQVTSLSSSERNIREDLSPLQNDSESQPSYSAVAKKSTSKSAATPATPKSPPPASASITTSNSTAATPHSIILV